MKAVPPMLRALQFNSHVHLLKCNYQAWTLSLCSRWIEGQGGSF